MILAFKLSDFGYGLIVYRTRGSDEIFVKLFKIDPDFNIIESTTSDIKLDIDAYTQPFITQYSKNNESSFFLHTRNNLVQIHVIYTSSLQFTTLHRPKVLSPSQIHKSFFVQHTGLSSQSEDNSKLFAGGSLGLYDFSFKVTDYY